MVDRGWGRWEWGPLLRGNGVLFLQRWGGGNGSVWGPGRGGGFYSTAKVLNDPELFTSKWLLLCCVLSP